MKITEKINKVLKEAKSKNQLLDILYSTFLVALDYNARYTKDMQFLNTSSNTAIEKEIMDLEDLLNGRLVKLPNWPKEAEEYLKDIKSGKIKNPLK